MSRRLDDIPRYSITGINFAFHGGRLLSCEDGEWVKLADVLAALSAPVPEVRELGWIVGNGDGTKWRKWICSGPTWTENRDEATRYARRVDAEAVHESDEDAWTVQWFSQAHDWFEFKGMKCCRVCSLVWNETSDTRACKGPSSVGIRSSLSLEGGEKL